MGVLTHLVVAPLADAAAVAGSGIKERTWPWVEGLGIPDIATIHCLMDGHDPREPVAPAEWGVNPFTKEKLIITKHNQYLRAFELVAEDEEVAVAVVPRRFVEAMSRLDSTAATELARRWRIAQSSERYGDGRPVPVFGQDVYTRCLETLGTIARTATERHEELFVWMCP